MSHKHRDALQKRLDKCYTAFMDSLQGKTTAELIAMAPMITAAKQIHDELPDCCSEDYATILLRFDDPMEIVRKWESSYISHDRKAEIYGFLWVIAENQKEKECAQTHRKDAQKGKGER